MTFSDENNLSQPQHWNLQVVAGLLSTSFLYPPQVVRNLAENRHRTGSHSILGNLNWFALQPCHARPLPRKLLKQGEEEEELEVLLRGRILLQLQLQLRSPAGAAALAAAAAAARPGVPRDGGRADEDPDLRVDPAAAELSRREAKNAGEQVDKFGFYDCIDVSAIICMFQN